MAHRLLHIGDLDDQVTSEILKAAFIPFGDIVSISMPHAAGLISSNDCF
jgi:hypothetical protein